MLTEINEYLKPQNHGFCGQLALIAACFMKRSGGDRFISARFYQFLYKNLAPE